MPLRRRRCARWLRAGEVMCTRRRLTLALSHLEVNTLPVVVGGRRAAMVA